jgi:hypothetical protein
MKRSVPNRLRRCIAHQEQMQQWLLSRCQHLEEEKEEEEEEEEGESVWTFDEMLLQLMTCRESIQQNQTFTRTNAHHMQTLDPVHLIQSRGCRG